MATLSRLLLLSGVLLPVVVVEEGPVEKRLLPGLGTGRRVVAEGRIRRRLRSVVLEGATGGATAADVDAGRSKDGGGRILFPEVPPRRTLRPLRA